MTTAHNLKIGLISWEKNVFFFSQDIKPIQVQEPVDDSPKISLNIFLIDYILIDSMSD